MDRRTAIKVIGGSVLGIAGLGALATREDIIRWLDADKAAMESGETKAGKVSTRFYKPLERELSVLGFGCMRFPMKNGEIDYELTDKMVDYAYRHGVNYYDTAYFYHGGKSEETIGRILKKYPRESFCLTDKMPTSMIDDPDDIPEIFEEQLRRCGVEYFDNYLLHSLSSMEKFERIYLAGGGLDYLREQKENGRIRSLGFSFHGDVPFFNYLMDNFTWDCTMIQLNYLDWNEANESPNGSRQAGSLYRKAEEKNVPCFIMEPVKGGNLAELPKNAMDILKRREPKKSAASWALRYVGTKPLVVTMLSGMSTIEQVVDNVSTTTEFKPLDDADMRVLNLSMGKNDNTGMIPCTYCRYCDPCPYGVDIAGVIKTYNLWAERLGLTEGGNGGIKEKKEFLVRYKNAVEKSARADHCTRCLKCMPRCPQSINIPTEMRKVDEFVQKLEKDIHKKAEGASV